MHRVSMFEILFQNVARLWGHFEASFVERYLNSVKLTACLGCIVHIDGN